MWATEKAVIQQTLSPRIDRCGGFDKIKAAVPSASNKGVEVLKRYNSKVYDIFPDGREETPAIDG